MIAVIKLTAEVTRSHDVIFIWVIRFTLFWLLPLGRMCYFSHVSILQETKLLRFSCIAVCHATTIEYDAQMIVRWTKTPRLPTVIVEWRINCMRIIIAFTPEQPKISSDQMNK